MTAPLIASTTEGAGATGGSLRRFRSEFPTAPRADQWDVVTGTGQTLTPAVTTQGTVLAVALGTTTNQTTTLTSTAIFSAPFKVSASIQLSQKIANNSVFLEAVACDPETGVVDESHVVAWCFSGSDNVTATNASVETLNGGVNRARLANQTVTSYVAGTLTTVAPPVTFEIEHLADEVWFHVRPSDAATGRANSYSRTTTVPDARAFKLRLRFVNGAVAPSSSTTVWVGHVTADSHTETPVEIVSARGSNQSGVGLPVVITGTPTVNVAASQLISLSANAAQVAPSTVRIDALLAAVQTIKAATNAYLFWATIFNPNAAMAAVHFYNTVSGEVVGTTVPVLTIPVPANSTVVLPNTGLPYLKNAAGLRVVATTTATTAGAVAPTTGLSVTVGYL